MQSYKVHWAIVAAIACVAFQEVYCGSGSSESSESEESGGGHHDCSADYKSMIWDAAFGNPETMKLAKVTLAKTVEMAKDRVCSDTVRSALDFGRAMATDKTAHDAIGMFLKLAKSAAKQAVHASPQFDATLNVVRRAFNDPQLLQMAAITAQRSVELLSDDRTRERLFRLLASVGTMTRPSDNEVKVKQSLKKVMGGIGSTTRMAKGAVLSLGKMLK